MRSFAKILAQARPRGLQSYSQHLKDIALLLEL
jgi:hypothetical protein